jgi:hypothetical protein
MTEGGRVRPGWQFPACHFELVEKSLSGSDGSGEGLLHAAEDGLGRSDRGGALALTAGDVGIS